MLLTTGTIHRQSQQEFARWDHALGEALGHPLELAHSPIIPQFRALTLASRRDYGSDMQTHSAILRFALPRTGWVARLRGRGFAKFSVGDLLNIVADGASAPRFYSLASGHADGLVESCVSRYSGGLCSGQLLALKPVDSIQAFVRANPDFRPRANAKPVILIGVGTGIGPLAGFARTNRPDREMHLSFGARRPDSDLFYGEDIQGWQGDGQFTSVTTAFSRTGAQTYVEDALRNDATSIARLVNEGAQVLVCGGRDMAAGLANTCMNADAWAAAFMVMGKDKAELLVRDQGLRAIFVERDGDNLRQTYIG